MGGLFKVCKQVMEAVCVNAGFVRTDVRSFPGCLFHEVGTQMEWSRCIDWRSLCRSFWTDEDE